MVEHGAAVRRAASGEPRGGSGVVDFGSTGQRHTMRVIGKLLCRSFGEHPRAA